jgi:DNA-binding CsgD family transcriptional regulator
MPGRRPYRLRATGGTRDRALLCTLVPLGMFLFTLGFIGSGTGITLLPSDPHHIGTQVVGLLVAVIGLTHWKWRAHRAGRTWPARQMIIFPSPAPLRFPHTSPAQTAKRAALNDLRSDPQEVYEQERPGSACPSSLQTGFAAVADKDTWMRLWTDDDRVVTLSNTWDIPLSSDIGSPGYLVGRDDELAVIQTLLKEIPATGRAMLVSGEPGIGKTTLLAAAADAASAAGTQVLHAAGAKPGSEVAFSGLNQILSPLLPDIRGLAPAHQEALQLALCFSRRPQPNRLVVSTATMALLHNVASRQPLLVTVDDLHRLDRTSLAVLGFIARRIPNGVGLLMAARQGQDGLIESNSVSINGLPTTVLQPISASAATKILHSWFPAINPRVRQRLIAEAGGNPLVLTELPTALTASQLIAVEALPSVLPLTPRLRALFEPRITRLPAETRRLLLLAALLGTGDLQVLQAATGTHRLLDDLAPAELGLLISLDNHGRLTFSHSLIPSTITQLATGSELSDAHRTLARVLLHQSDRHAWHLAEAANEPDERVAVLLDEVTQRMLNRGDLPAALTTATRAAALSPVPSDRARRLADAASLHADSGELSTAWHLLDAARRADPDLAGSLRDASADARLLLDGGGDVDTIHQALVTALRARLHLPDPVDNTLIEALTTLWSICVLAGRRPDLWQPFHEAVTQLGPQIPLELVLMGTVGADAARSTASSLAELDLAIVGLRDEYDPMRIVRIAHSALHVDRLPECRGALWRVVRMPAGAGRIGVIALLLLCVDSFHTGQWETAERLADKGIEMSKRHAPGVSIWPLQCIQSLLAAVRGDGESTRGLCDEMSKWAVKHRVATVQYLVLRTCVLEAIGQEDFEEAYRLAAIISSPGEFPRYAATALLVCMDLVEAAVHTSRFDEANAHVAAMYREGIDTVSPRLALAVAGSAAIAATDASRSKLFEKALSLPNTDQWLFDRARVQLAYGEHLHLIQSTSRARTHLSAALDVFQRLGAQPWATRASTKLRSIGQTRQAGNDLDSAALTPQELEIATLAASGMTNKQIAERLYLSHRTVANHLYRVFPKLGITSRGSLRDALGDADAEPGCF